MKTTAYFVIFRKIGFNFVFIWLLLQNMWQRHTFAIHTDYVLSGNCTQLTLGNYTEKSKDIWVREEVQIRSLFLRISYNFTLLIPLSGFEAENAWYLLLLLKVKGEWSDGYVFLCACPFEWCDRNVEIHVFKG